MHLPNNRKYLDSAPISRGSKKFKLELVLRVYYEIRAKFTRKYVKKSTNVHNIGAQHAARGVAFDFLHFFPVPYRNKNAKNRKRRFVTNGFISNFDAGSSNLALESLETAGHLNGTPGFPCR